MAYDDVPPLKLPSGHWAARPWDPLDGPPFAAGFPTFTNRMWESLSFTVQWMRSVWMLT